jgi:hypothetical protein
MQLYNQLFIWTLWHDMCHLQPPAIVSFFSGDPHPPRPMLYPSAHLLFILWPPHSPPLRPRPPASRGRGGAPTTSPPTTSRQSSHCPSTSSITADDKSSKSLQTLIRYRAPLTLIRHPTRRQHPRRHAPPPAWSSALPPPRSPSPPPPLATPPPHH